jgi:methylated-DNA-[protein]-cysteine S-methyltransferase
MDIDCLARENFPKESAVATVTVSDAELGKVALGWYSGALCLCMLGERAVAASRACVGAWGGVCMAGDAAVERASCLALAAFKRGTDRDFPPVILVGTAFQHAVWCVLSAVARGTTASYRDITQRLGRGCPRSVGTAIGKNPVSLFVPCHRVIGGDGRLCGYAWGLALKKKLLGLERRPERCFAPFV